MPTSENSRQDIGDRTGLPTNELDFLVWDLAEIIERHNPPIERDAFCRDEAFKEMFEEMVNSLLSYGIGLELDEPEE